MRTRSQGSPSRLSRSSPASPLTSAQPPQARGPRFNKWRSDLVLTYPDHLKDVTAILVDNLIESMHEWGFYEFAAVMLFFLTSTYRHTLYPQTKRSLSVGPQGPVYFHRDLLAGLISVPPGTPPTRSRAQKARGNFDEPESEPVQSGSSLMADDGSQVELSHQSADEVIQEYLRNPGDESMEYSSTVQMTASAVDTSFDASSPEESIYRLVDFNIYIRRYLPSMVKVVGAAVEIKPYYPRQSFSSLNSLKIDADVANIFTSMLPQTIQQVQFVFHEYGVLDETWAIMLVPPFCQFLKFSRENVPPLDQGDRKVPKVFQLPPGGPRDLVFLSNQEFRAIIPIFTNGDYSPEFKERWDSLMKWTKTVPLTETDKAEARERESRRKKGKGKGKAKATEEDGKDEENEEAWEDED